MSAYLPTLGSGFRSRPPTCPVMRASSLLVWSMSKPQGATTTQSGSDATNWWGGGRWVAVHGHTAACTQRVGSKSADRQVVAGQDGPPGFAGELRAQHVPSPDGVAVAGGSGAGADPTAPMGRRELAEIWKILPLLFACKMHEGGQLLAGEGTSRWPRSATHLVCQHANTSSLWMARDAAAPAPSLQRLIARRRGFAAVTQQATALQGFAAVEQGRCPCLQRLRLQNPIEHPVRFRFPHNWKPLKLKGLLTLAGSGGAAPQPSRSAAASSGLRTAWGSGPGQSRAELDGDGMPICPPATPSAAPPVSDGSQQA
jgi:hypothetical protein